MSLVELDRYTDAAQAHIIRGRLEAAGVPAFCLDDGINAAFSQPLMFPVRVMVLADDVSAAWTALGEGPAITEAETAAENYHTGRRRRRLTFALVAWIVCAQVLVFMIVSLNEPDEAEQLQVGLMLH